MPLRSAALYSESVRAVETRSTAIRGQQIIESQMRRLDEKEPAMREKDETMADNYEGK
jgi:hypothetical protein